MMWQMWTAFGIMLGFVASLGFGYIEGNAGIPGIMFLNWRLSEYRTVCMIHNGADSDSAGVNWHPSLDCLHHGLFRP